MHSSLDRARANRLLLAGLLTSASIFGPAITAHAADAAAPAASDQSAPIIVIGQRTEPLEAPSSISKTGTPLKDLPRTIQIVSRDLLDDQGAIKLTDVLANVSSAAQGGQYAFGFFDRVIIRGLNATYLTDGLPDETSDLTGIPHTLTGVERVEVIKGPGSALYGTSEQGGMINLVHYRPQDQLSAGLSEQYGSYNTSTTSGFVTGSTGVADLDYRLDASYIHSDGFRGLGSKFFEVLPALSWRPANHDVEARVEIRHIDTIPDAAGIPFSPPTGIGLPAPVSIDNRYYTPFARGDQDIVRLLTSDAWSVADGITINNRLSYTHRDVDILRNTGGTVALLNGVYGLKSRQLRKQHDDLDDTVYQLEPKFVFSTMGLHHTLLTGFQAEVIDGHVTRSTADLPNIASLVTPITPETSVAGLTFLCDATHSCADADISARYYSLYAADQIDLTSALKLRLSARNDWDKTQGIATSSIPVNAGMEQPCSPLQKVECQWLPGVPVGRHDSLFSWDVGAVYFLVPQFSLFAGAENARYPVFNTEEPESIGSVPEGGKQVEAGARLTLGSRLTATTSLFDVHRDSVFVVFADPVTGLDAPTTFSYRVRGWEGDINAQPIDHWIINANFSWQKPVITNYPQTTADVGKWVPSDPRVLVNGYTQYEFALGQNAGKLRLNAGIRYRGRSYTDAGNTRMLPASTLTDLGIGWSKDRLDLSFGVKNVFDRANWVGGAGTGGGALPGPGRNVFGRAAVKF